MSIIKSKLLALLENEQMPLLALSLGFFMVILDVTIVNVALPNLAISLNTNISGLQWVVDGYTLTFACFLLSAGNLSDRIGAKNIFLLGLALFVLASIGCGLANSLRLLTFFRLIQGFGAALLVPTSLALINASYADKQQRAKAIGVWSMIGGIAGAAGPILGATLTAAFSWRAVFFVNIPFGIICFLLSYRCLASAKANYTKSSFEWPGQITGMLSIAALAFSLIEAGKLGWTSPLVLIGFGVFILSLIFFIKIEQCAQAPMFPLTFFKSPNFSVAIFIGMVLNISVYGEMFVLSLYFQQVRGYSVLLSGFAFMPLLGVIVFTAYFAGKLTSKVGPKLPMFIGLLVGAIGFFSLLHVAASAPYYCSVLPLACMGFGIAFCMPAATVAAIHAAPSDRAGLAAGAFNASRQIGSLIGVAIFGTLIASATDFMQGMHLTLWIGGIAFALGCLSVLWMRT